MGSIGAETADPTFRAVTIFNEKIGRREYPRHCVAREGHGPENRSDRKGATENSDHCRYRAGYGANV
jgi:hypothetical protein